MEWRGDIDAKNVFKTLPQLERRFTRPRQLTDRGDESGSSSSSSSSSSSGDGEQEQEQEQGQGQGQEQE